MPSKNEVDRLIFGEVMTGFAQRERQLSSISAAISKVFGLQSPNFSGTCAYASGIRTKNLRLIAPAVSEIEPILWGHPNTGEQACGQGTVQTDQSGSSSLEEPINEQLPVRTWV